MTLTDERSPTEIEDQAQLLCAVAFDIDGPMIKTWNRLSDKQKEGYRRLARAIPGAVHIESAESGGYPTAPQADTICELRACFEAREEIESWRERSWIAGGTRPYAEMVVTFEWDEVGRDEPMAIGYLVHPDGHHQRLDHYRIAGRDER